MRSESLNPFWERKTVKILKIATSSDHCVRFKYLIKMQVLYCLTQKTTKMFQNLFWTLLIIHTWVMFLLPIKNDISFLSWNHDVLCLNMAIKMSSNLEQMKTLNLHWLLDQWLSFPESTQISKVHLALNCQQCSSWQNPETGHKSSCKHTDPRTPEKNN